MRLFWSRKKMVKVIEPYQMLGEIDTELQEAMGVDVVGINPRNTIFGFFPILFSRTVMSH